MLKIAIQMDPIEAVDVNADTTFDMALEAFGRGHEIFVYAAQSLQLNVGEVHARAQRVEKIARKQGEHVTLSAPMLLDLRNVDVVLIR